MSNYSTKIVYEDSQSRESIVTESGQPSSVTLQGLTPNERYTAKAELYSGLQKVAESSISSFTTLAAGSVSLTFVSTTQVGSNYVVKYTISSTYAMSNAILVANSNNFQGVIAGNDVTFTVSGLTHGVNYPYTVTANDIYNETGTASGTIVTDTNSNEYFTVTDLSGSANTLTIKVNNSGGSTPFLTFYYSTNGGTSWTSVTSSTSGVDIPISANGSVILKHEGTVAYEKGGYIFLWHTIKCSGNHKVSGNIASLAYGDNFTGTKSMTGIYYHDLFNRNTTLVSANDLYLGSFATLSKSCYDSMFYDCTALTSAPSLPAETLAQSCYAYMFCGCTSLTYAPALPVTVLSDSCYTYMFYGCSTLTSAPALPATTLTRYCYQDMFSGCTSLTSAPALPAKTMQLSCYSLMFAKCTSLTTGPDLSHVTTLATSCCASMYEGCTSLTTAYAPSISTWSTSNMANWLKSVGQSGTLYATTATAAVIPTNNVSGCPSGWSIATI